MAILFVGWFALFVYMIYRFRAKKNPQASYRGPQSHASSYVEGAVAVAEAVLLIGFSIPLWYQRVDAFPAPTAEPIEVRVVAEQFAWNVHYPGPDGIFGRSAPEMVDATTNPLGLDSSDPAGADDITTINQLHLPVDRPAIVQLSSKDVIHSFMLNEFRVKQDAMPGLEIPVWFEPTVTTAEMRRKTGNDEYTYEIACAQLCGLGHFRMRGFLTIHEQDEFDQWLIDNAPVEGEEGDAFWN